VTESDELSILEAAGSDPKPSRVWLGGAVAVVILIGLTMAALAIVVVVIWAASFLFSLAVPTLPGPLF
jgi:hypothetical protein